MCCSEPEPSGPGRKGKTQGLFTGAMPERLRLSEEFGEEALSVLV